MQIYLLLFMLGGLALSAVFHFNGIQNEQWYLLTTATLLAIGLYSSTYGISLQDARKHVKLIINAVTIGVLLKALLIGSIAAYFLKTPFGYILGIIVAQIDPLSTAALQKEGRLTTQAKTILAAWSSFDDPITVILSIYIPVILANVFKNPGTQFANMHVYGGVIGYITAIGINIFYALIVYLFWSLLKRHTKHPKYIIVLSIILGAYLLMIATFSLAIYFFWMLGIALVGLFMRPKIEKILTRTVEWALYMAAILLGILLVNGINIISGLLIGIAAFISQMLVGYILCRNLPKRDKIHIAFAQQNGITSIILALLFEPYYPGTVAIVAPAIMTINIIHTLSNTVIDLRTSKRFFLSYFLPKHHKLRTHI